MKRLNSIELTKAIENRIILDLLDNNVGGASVLVEQSGEIVYKAHFGTSDGQSAAITDRTLFRLASMTKPITATATMILAERGLLSLEDTVDRFYPAFAATEQRITLRHLLTHSSGIGSGTVWQESVKKMTAADRASVEAYVAFLSRQPLSFVPGTKQEYSGTGAFSVLTGIIQRVTGMSYEEFLQKEIFEPCGMTDTTFEPSRDQWSRLIAMHNKRDGESVIGKTYEGCVFENIPTENYLGGAGLISSLGDYLNFARMLRDGGVFEGHRILSEESVREMARPQVFHKSSESWGLGMRSITDESGALPVGSYGWSGAYGTHFWIDPQNQIIAIYMKNSHYDGGSGAITSKNFEIDVYSSLERE